MLIFRFLFFSCILFCSCNSSTVEYNDVNSLLNLSFENPNDLHSSGWNTNSYLNWSIDSTEANGGKYSLRIKPDTLHTQWFTFGPIPIFEETKIIEIECYTKKVGAGVDSITLKVQAYEGPDYKRSGASSSIFAVKASEKWEKPAKGLNK